VLLLREAVQTFLGSSDVHQLDGPDDADIDAGTIADMIKEGRFTESEFIAFCDSFGVPARHPDGDFHHIASQAFLSRKRGQEIMSLSLPTDHSAVNVYAALAKFARERNFRLYCPMPLVGGDIDLDDPGQLPPHWDQYVR
jgi:hypothetical protein